MHESLGLAPDLDVIFYVYQFNCVCCDHIFCSMLNDLIEGLKSIKTVKILIPVVLFYNNLGARAVIIYFTLFLKHAKSTSPKQINPQKIKYLSS